MLIVYLNYRFAVYQIWRSTLSKKKDLEINQEDLGDYE
jgi:hypothetical protein